MQGNRFHKEIDRSLWSD